MPLRDQLQDLDVSGVDQVDVVARHEHQDVLTALVEERADDPRGPDRIARLLPTLGPTPCCEVHAGGRAIGELPADLASEVHAGLLALAMLDPPYVVAVPLIVERREREGAAEVTATALLDLQELRLLAS